MKNSIISLVLASSLTLAGCATTGTGEGGAVTPQDIVAQVITDAQLACRFVPDAAFVIQLIGAAVPGLSTASAIANAICASVTSKTARRTGAPPSVAGIVVRGHFI